jgi:hypothetical protein
MKKMVPAIWMTLALLAAVSARADVYKWINPDSGETEYAHSMPVRDPRIKVIYVIDEKTGVVTETIRYLTPEEEQELKAKNAAKRRQQERDANLVKAYLSVEEIERLRSERVETLDAQIQVKSALLYGQERKLAELKKELSNFNFPVKSDSELPPAPENLLLEYANTLEQVDTYRGDLETLETRKTEINRQFAADIERFRALKGQTEDPADQQRMR